MTMHWMSYLVRVHPEVDGMDERMERAHRSEVITDQFIRPQADEIALAYETKNVFQRLIQDVTSYGTTDPNRIVTHLAPRVRHMAIQDQLKQIPCLAPIMMWDYLYEVVRETLSPKPRAKRKSNSFARPVLRCLMMVSIETLRSSKRSTEPSE